MPKSKRTAPSSINWTIVPAKNGFIVADRNELVATIRHTGEHWLVEFKDHPDLNFSWAGGDQRIAVGYVRGIERMMVLERHNDGKAW